MGTLFEGVTIDPEGAKDLDDAIWVSRDDQGWIVQVAFPRLTHAVALGGRIDALARERVVSIYRGARFTLPMLPQPVTERLSLTRGECKDVFLTTMRIGSRFTVESFACELATFKSVGQLTYDLASTLVRTGPGPVGEMLGHARDLAHGLFETRRASGAIAYYNLETGVAFDEEGAAILLTGEGHVAEMIVSEFMVLTNTCLARWAIEAGIPILFRNHAQLASRTRQEVLANLPGVTGDVDVAVRNLPRLVARANIGVTPTGHYGLNLHAYAWFTSPLRRYPDLVNQRMIEAHLTGSAAPHDGPDLVAFADIINTKLTEQADRTAAHFKSKALQAAAERVTTGEVGSASTVEFGHVVKVLAENPDTLTRAAEDETVKRIEAGSLPSKEMTRVLLIGGRVAQAAIARLVVAPNDAINVLNYGAQSLGWPTPRFDDTKGGPAHAMVFATRGSMTVGGVEHTSPQVVRHSKKAAQQSAAVHLLASIAGVPMPTEAEIPEKEAQATQKATVGPEQNPRNRLQELCAKRGIPLPTFTVTEHGPPQDRTFSAVVTLVIKGVTRSSRPGRGRTRKEAEKAAAAEMLTAISAAARSQPRSARDRQAAHP